MLHILFFTSTCGVRRYKVRGRTYLNNVKRLENLCRWQRTHHTHVTYALGWNDVACHSVTGGEHLTLTAWRVGRKPNTKLM